VPSKIVGVVVHDLLVRGKNRATISDCIDALPDDESTNRVKGLLASLVRQVGNDAEAFKKLVEEQFNAAMTKASERYKTFAQTMTLVVAVVLVAGANADSIAIAQSLAASPAARVAMVSYARQVVGQDDNFLGHAALAAPAPATSAASEMQDEKMHQARKELSKVHAIMNLAGLQIGWQAFPSNFGGWIEKFFGLLITILAVSLGAPFWFKALQKFMVVRDELAGKKSDSAPVPSDKAGDGAG
jgi:DNA-binding protein YbaB